MAESLPYRLPSVPHPDLIPENLGHGDLWNAFEFFRIEFLLRSPKVWTLYRKAEKRTAKKRPARIKTVRDFIRWQYVPRRGPQSKTLWRLLKDTTLQEQFRVADGWAVIGGSHIRYLKLNSYLERNSIPGSFETFIQKFQTPEGIVNLSRVVRSRQFKLLRRDDPEILMKELSGETNSALYLRIDRTIDQEIAVRGLRRMFGEKHAPQVPKVNALAYDPKTRETTILSDPDGNPPITDLRAWLNYLLCYDLSRSGRRLRDIGIMVYGPVGPLKVKRELAKKAVTRVKRFIVAAERGPLRLQDFKALVR